MAPGFKRKSSSSSSSNGGAKRHRANASRKPDLNEKLYTLNDSILVLGDGDFTFSRGLVTHRGGGRNLCATSYDSEAQVKSKYSNASDSIKSVRAAGATVFHGIDATKLHAVPHGSKSVPFFFQYIIFNFPHTGQQRVHLNRVLLVEFFESARRKLVKAGEVHITLKNRPPYSNWQVEEQAKTAGFVLKARRKFHDKLFPGYNHRTTDPQAKKFEAELCTTYVFIVNRSKYPFDPSQATATQAKESSGSPVQSDAEEEEAKGHEEDCVVALSEQDLVAVLPSKKKNRKRRKSPAVPTSAESSTQPSVGSVVSAIDAVPSPGRRKTSAVPWRPLHRRL